MMDYLDPIQSLLEPRLGKGKIGLHRQSSLPEQVPELHLLLVTKDELGLSRLTGARPHQLMGHPRPMEDPAFVVSCDDRIITNS